MKVIIFLAMVFVPSTILGQRKAYSHKTEQEALKFAYNILKVYYPSNELCVSDSIYDLDWHFFEDKVNDQTKQILSSHRIEKKFKWDSPVYSNEISSLFSSYPCDSCKYVAHFSAPYNGMIRCDIMPKDGKIGIYGMPQISIFLFRYNEKGEVIQISKSEVDID